MSQSPEWGDGLSRLVVAAAIYGDLLDALPGAFTPELFGESGSPRQRIAKVISAYVEKYSTRPTPEIVDELLRREMEPLSGPEQEAVQTEWEYVQQTELPDDQTYILDQVRGWIEYKRLESAIQEAATVLGSKGADGLDEARETLSRFEIVKRRDDGPRRVQRFLGDAEERLDLWRAGIEMGERVPTGLAALDAALSGGPTRKEVWYYLAPPKGGKTAFLLRTALGAARARMGVFLTTFEMQAQRMLLRLDRMASGQSKEQLNDDQVALLKSLEGFRVAQAGDVYVQQRRTQEKNSVANVGREVERIRKEGGKIDVVIFDYLNIMGSTKTEREKRFELASISREMSDMAKELDVVVWSAALVNRQAVDKSPIRKTDIAEAFEVIAVADGVVAICSPPVLVENRVRRLWVSAAREEQDEALAGDYSVDFPRMTIQPTPSQAVDTMLAAARRTRRLRDGEET